MKSVKVEAWLHAAVKDAITDASGVLVSKPTSASHSSSEVMLRHQVGWRFSNWAKSMLVGCFLLTPVPGCQVASPLPVCFASALAMLQCVPTMLNALKRGRAVCGDPGRRRRRKFSLSQAFDAVQAVLPDTARAGRFPTRVQLLDLGQQDLVAEIQAGTPAAGSCTCCLASVPPPAM